MIIKNSSKMIAKITSVILLQFLFSVTVQAIVLKQETLDDVIVTVKLEANNGTNSLISETRQINDQQVISYCQSSLDANETGWTTFYAWTNKDIDNEKTSYYVGYDEGALLTDYLVSYWRNTFQNFCDGQEDVCKQVRSYLQANNEWISSMIDAHKSTDDYWWQVNLIYKQFNGIVDGYKSFKAPTDPDISNEDFWFMHLRGELFDLVNKFSKPGDQCKYSYEGLGSAIVKLTKGNKDILVGQNSWFGYNTMTRLGKRYALNHRVNQKSQDLIPGQVLSMSGYPSIIHSIDEFYTTSSGLVVQETSFQNYNEKLWTSLKSKDTVFEFIRALVANRLATNGESWSKIFAKYNSGTYNNQWMIVDYNKFTPGETPKKGLLWIVEQIPGLVRAKDATHNLIKATYWASYNVPSDKKVYKLAGYDKMEKKYGSWFSYENSPRALIFKRDQEKLSCICTMIGLIRSNDYKEDPHSTCKCKPTHNAAIAIAARNDLNPQNGSYPFAHLARHPGGAIDAKATDYKLMKNRNFIGLSGPTRGKNLPVFQWSKSDYDKTVSHVGQPDTWDFRQNSFTWEF